MGNPNGATADTSFPDNYLMMKLQYALSYNNSRRIPNWTSWHLDITWRGSAPRQDDFRNDTTLPPGFNQVQGTDLAEERSALFRVGLEVGGADEIVVGRV